MFELQKETNLDFLINSDLEQISIGEFQIILKFSGKLEITIEGKLDIEHKNNIMLFWSNEQKEGLDYFYNLVGRKIVSYKILDNNTLKIIFNNSAILTLYDSNGMFESYQITKADKFLII